MYEEFEGTQPVSERMKVDLGALAAYMREHVAGFGGELQIEGEVVHVIAHRLVDLSRWLGSLAAPSRDFH